MIGIIDYGMGNLRSVYNAIEHVGQKPKLIKVPEDFAGVSHLIIPGVGAFSTAMRNLENKGFLQPINEFVSSGSPVLGICLGMQLLATLGSEHSETKGLDIINGEIHKFDLPNQRVPHVGWNSIVLQNDHSLFKGIKKDVDFYFVHSYHFVLENNKNELATTDYGRLFTSVVFKDNVVGVQFHPEKSQKNGLKILSNFIEA